MKKELLKHLKPGDIIRIEPGFWDKVKDFFKNYGYIRSREEELILLNKYNKQLSVMAFIALLILVVASFLIR